MSNNTTSFISYRSKGDKIFHITFPIENIRSLKVYVGNNEVIAGKDYKLKILENKKWAVEFFNPLGSIEAPQIISLQKVINPQRLTNLSNQSHLNTPNLNKEFDNIISNQNTLNANITRCLKINNGSYTELFLPQNNNNKALIWASGNLENSKHDIDTALETLLNFMNELKTNGLHNCTQPCENTNIKEIAPAPTDVNQSTNPNINTTPTLENIKALLQTLIANITATEIKYKGENTTSNLKNVQEALHALSNSANIKYLHDNVQNTLTKLSSALNIHFNNTKTNLPNASNVQNAIEALDTKINTSTTKYIGDNHCIVSGTHDTLGLSGHLVYNNKAFHLNIKASPTQPLVINFSHQNEANLVSSTLDAELSFHGKTGITLYIYADLDPKGNISYGFKEKKPYYLYHNPILFPKSTLMLKDIYQEADFFYIPTLTMYNSKGESLKRIYIGQVRFNTQGTPQHLNNYIFGTSFAYDLRINKDTQYSIPNRIGNQNIIVNTYFKEKAIMGGTVFYKEEENHGNITIVDTTNGNHLKTGVTHNITDEEIWGVVGLPDAHRFFSKNSKNSVTLSAGILRIFCKRLF